MFGENLTEKANILYALMLLYPERLQKEFETGNYSTEEIEEACREYMNDCFLDLLELKEEDEYGNFKVHREGRDITLSEYPSSHIHQVVQVLLDFGLDPNKVFIDRAEDGRIREEYNIMHELHWIMNGYEAADSLELLLSHGGDPNLKIGGITLLEQIYSGLKYDMFGQTDRLHYDSSLHYFFVLAGHGAKFSDGSKPLELFDDFEVSDLQDHRRFDWAIIHTDDPHDGWKVSIFEKESGIEVARA